MIFLGSRVLWGTINLGGNEELISDPALLSPFAYNLFGRFILAGNDCVKKSLGKI